jgi:DNA-binding Lrp family transcriptional regulator
LIQGKTNQEISKNLKIPLSTIQRRAKSIFNKDILMSKIHINYELLGFSTGLVHIYLSGGNIDAIADRVYEDGITSVEVHIGNSDILGHVIYKEGKDLLNIISAIKKMNGVEQVVWSERIYQSPVKHYNKIGNMKIG